MRVWVVRERVAAVVCMSGTLVPGSAGLDGISGVEVRTDSLGLAPAGDDGLSEELGTEGVERINGVEGLGVSAGVLLDATAGDEGLAEELSTLDVG